MKDSINMKNFYKNKKVLVTGADGFMGSHLTEKLINLGAKASIYIRGNSITGTALYTLKNIKHIQSKLVEIITGNIATRDAIDLIKANKPQIIFHLAADAYVPNSFRHPIEVMETNVIGTLNIFHAAKEIKNIEKIIITSSSEIYGSALKAKIDENHLLNPSSPYAASKVAADRYAYSYWNTYNMPIAIIRPFNTYGPRHTYDVIPKFIRLAFEGKPITIYGTGKQSRDFTYIDDMIEAFLIMGSNPKAIGRAVNFGTGRHISIERIAKLIKELSASDSKIIYIKKRLAEVECLCCDYALAKRLFGWEPKISIEEGLKRNIEWEKENWIRKNA